MNLGPRQLSELLVQRYNARDLDGMLDLVADDVEFIRPGPSVVHGREAVRERYEQDWRTLDTPRVDLIRVVTAGDDVAAEIRITFTQEGSISEVGGAVFHTWRNGLLRRYRAYLDVPLV